MNVNSREIHHFIGWEGGGFRGTKIANKYFVNKLAFPLFQSETVFLEKVYENGEITIVHSTELWKPSLAISSPNENT